MAEPSGALQGHFVRSRCISSRITSGPRDEVVIDLFQRIKPGPVTPPLDAKLSAALVQERRRPGEQRRGLRTKALMWDLGTRLEC